MITSVPKNESTIDETPKFLKLLEGEKFLDILMVFISVSTTLVILFG